MSRYLKQEDVLNRIAGAYSEHGEQVPLWLHIGDLPSADVVEVVRCKDCRYNEVNMKPNFYETYSWCHLISTCDNGEGFCCKGEAVPENIKKILGRRKDGDSK